MKKKYEEALVLLKVLWLDPSLVFGIEAKKYEDTTNQDILVE